MSEATVDSEATSVDAILDAVRELLIDIGPRRVTMADVARTSGVSRATLYRRFPNAHAVVAAVFTREFSAIIEPYARIDGVDRTAIVTSVVELAATARQHPLIRAVKKHDPEFLLPYLLQRRGRVWTAQHGMLSAAISEAQQTGTIRAGRAGDLATAVLLSAWSFTVTGPAVTERDQVALLDTELELMLTNYLSGLQA